MTKRRKRQQFSIDKQYEACWKPVPVELPQTNGRNDDKYYAEGDDNQESNHYDDPKLQRIADNDLPVQPGEDIAMFYGLEVLDYSQYELAQAAIKKKQNVKKNHSVKNDDDKHPQHQHLIVRERSSSNKKRESQNKKSNISNQERVVKNDQEGSVSKSNSNNNSENDTSLSSNKKKKVNIDEKTADTNLSKSSTSKSSKNEKRPREKTSSISSEIQSHDSATDGEPSSISMPAHLSQPQNVIEDIQMNWSRATGGAVLNERLCRSLASLGYTQPTQIQSATLSAAVLGRRNLVGAAPTGSGKTLAFLLPILQFLLEQEEVNRQSEKFARSNSTCLQALIVTPTRELALQIHTECEKLLPKRCVGLVGGIALAKQKRLLLSKPRVIVATPGRLWAMISSGDHPHLHDLSQIRFLVLDEADRMVQKHCFPQLLQILDAIHSANPGLAEDGTSEEEESYQDSEDNEGDFLSALPGIRGEAKVTMLTDDIIHRVMAQKNDEMAETMEVPDEEYLEDESSEEIAEQNENIEFAFEDTQLKLEKPVHRQTFIYSATLTLPHTATKSRQYQSESSKKARRGKVLLDGAIAEILEKTRAMGQTKVVDLSSSSAPASTHPNTTGQSQSSMKAASNGVRLPPGLLLEQIKCIQRHKDSHLYAYLVTTVHGSSGPCLVFCNSIACVRRVGITLQKLGLPVRILHAHMQQRARFKAVESLKSPKSRAVVVSTDVAARGLDIPSVATVIHYDVARAVDTFVHRSGRTARGVGEGAVGSSLSLVAPAEDNAHKRIVDSMQLRFADVAMDGRLLTAAQERTNLASKIASAEELLQKTHSRNKWFEEKAAEAGLEVDDNLLEDNDNRPQREMAQLREAASAKIRLARLLAQPMKTQRFGKFLSSNSAAVHSEVVPFIVPEVQSRPKKRKKRARK